MGEGEFVEQMLKEAGEAFEKESLFVAQGWDMDKLAEHVANVLDMDISEIWSAGKYRPIVRARSLLCYWAVRESDVSMASLAKRLGISSTAVMQPVARGERLTIKILIIFFKCIRHLLITLPIPDDAAYPIHLTLVFKGTMGNEADAGQSSRFLMVTYLA